MFGFVLKRLLYTIPIVIGVCSLTFFLIHLVPGDPLDLILGDNVSAFDRTSLSRRLGLNLPLLDQYKKFMLNLFQLDLGRSIYSQQSVFKLISERLPATAELTLAAMSMALFIGIPFGVLSAIKKKSNFDRFTFAASILGLSTPGIFLGPMLILLFSLQLSWFPVSDRGGLDHLFLPALSLAIPLGAVIIRMTRTSMLEEIHQDYITVARAKGLSERKIYFKHALKNSLIPIITIVGLQTGALLTGTIITETIFDWPGLGTLLLQSINQRDYPTIQGCILFIALIYVLVNLFTDIAYTFANPKLKEKSQK